ncbi:MAG TPA: type IX secretion system sortase PorU [Bacteroidales bacterium]|nr:type IX secretion system sortase PorU [Bacteroidales bacterium]
MRRILQITCLLLFPACLFCQSTGSVLSSGSWFRIAVPRDGIYRLGYSTLKKLGLVNPSNPRIYCNNQGQLSYYNDNTARDDLREIAVYASTGSDGILNEGDYILFYGKGTHRWSYNPSAGEYEYKRHNYSDTSVYFLTSGSVQGRRMVSFNAPVNTPVYYSNSSDALFIHELENDNLIRSGREWFQQIGYSSTEIKPEFSGLLTSERIKAHIRAAARSQGNTEISFSESGRTIKILKFQPVNFSNSTGTFANIADSSFSFTAGSAAPVFSVRFSSNGNQGSLAWLDYVILQARVENTYSGGFRQFSDSRSVGAGMVTSFGLECASDPLIWDVTDQYNPKIIQYNRNGNTISFAARTDSLRTFAVFTNASEVNPEIYGNKIPNQDLHSSPDADMIIISHPMFRRYAEKLADIHMKKNGLTSLIVTPGEIYNEFSGGIPDIAALRNFVRMKYLKQAGTTKPLKYLLLFGDGSFDNKSPFPNPAFIPTYQSKNSNVFVSSFTSDDFYGLLEDGEGESEGTEDIGIGRLPVSDTVQAGLMISKIRRYLDDSGMGDWRNIVCLAADDEDGNAHATDAEGLAAEISSTHPEFNIHKIYLDAYRQVTSETGQSYPDVNAAINNRINAGCLIFNYVGHGNETGLAHERVLRSEDIRSWRNAGKLPLFITATCEFSRYDNVEINLASGERINNPSAGELVLFSKEGGAIALLSTTRVVFSGPNYFLNRSIYDTAFSFDSSGNPLALGDIIRIAKRNAGNNNNKRNFSLLGDPALILAWPKSGKIFTDSVNSVPVTGDIDTLKALSLVTISGHLSNRNGSLADSYNGILNATIFDKESHAATRSNDGGPVMYFNTRDNILFSGRANISNGRFSLSFIVPRDIDYSFGEGKVSYYTGYSGADMNGYFNRIIVGGFSSYSMRDSTGPEIRLFMNDTLFRNGGVTDSNPVLYALLSDNGGLNTTGSGIGHDITGSLDKAKNTTVLNSYYVNALNDYTSGTLSYNLTGLSKGNHSFTLRAWDNFNNSSEETLLFVVKDGDKLIISDLINYPNPFSEKTTITAGINKPDEELEITLQVFSMDGRLIKEFRTMMPSGSYSLSPIEWDGIDNSGRRVNKGLYPYVVTVRSKKGETVRGSGRMIIL